MLVQWNYHFANSLEGAALEVSLWNGHPPWPNIMHFEAPSCLNTLQFLPDLQEEGPAGWKPTNGVATVLNCDATAEAIMRFFLDHIQKQQ